MNARIVESVYEYINSNYGHKEFYYSIFILITSLCLCYNFAVERAEVANVHLNFHIILNIYVFSRATYIYLETTFFHTSSFYGFLSERE